MIIFHEGLPRSGKSYEAALKQIIPSLQKGRKVFAYIDGLNHEKFAEVSGISLERVVELLHQLQKEQIADVYNHVENDSLVLLDELQDFFPAGKSGLSTDMTEFVTQHGHRGIDIICMGQDHRDCHMLWKRRIDTLITFVKRDAVGRANEYTWTTFKQQSGKFKQLRSGKGTYDSKYFGLYKSHLDGVTSIDDHKDDRINIFKSSVFTFYIPLFAVVLCVSVYYLYGFLTGRSSPVKFAPVVESHQVVSPETKQPAKEITPSQPVPPAKPVPPTDIDYLEKYLTDYRPRLVALVESKPKNKMFAQIEFIDGSNRVFERLNIPQIVAFGYVVERKPYGLLLKRGDKRFPVTAFPVDMSKGVTRHPEEVVSR
ncbi:MAG: zonular occludens toxin domain-containing protein [Methylobacter sp.]|nr:zonular occludens toxin domain-containing protein [Methylobacter sp.]